MMRKIKRVLAVKKNGKLIWGKVILLLVVSIFCFDSGVTFSRYAYTNIRNFYFTTKKFYFNSDKLTEEGAVIEMDNWSGVGEYAVTFNMNSYANNNLYSEDDIFYDIQYTCSDNVICSAVDGKTSGVIYKTTNTDSFTILISVPTDTILHDRDRVELKVEATSVSPYKKKLSGTFSLVVGYYGLAYEITDQEGSPYLETRITNTLDYYTVKEAFATYPVGTQIDIPTYLALSSEDQAKCASAVITLRFDPSVVLLDMTSEDYLRAIKTTKRVIDGHDYIDSITFSIDALSSEQVKFYKENTARDYTYPNLDNTSVVEVLYE